MRTNQSRPETSERPILTAMRLRTGLRAGIVIMDTTAGVHWPGGASGTLSPGGGQGGPLGG